MALTNPVTANLVNRVVNRVTPRGRKQPQSTGDLYTMAMRQQRRDRSVLSNYGQTRTRLGITTECRAMYDDDVRVRRLITKSASDAARGGFTIEMSEDTPQTQRAYDIAQAVIDRVGMADRFDDLLRISMRDGDSFQEYGVSVRGSEMFISEMTTLDAMNVHRVTDFRDKFVDPRYAFWFGELWAWPYWDDMTWLTKPELHRIAASSTQSGNGFWYPAFLLNHARYAHDDGDRYGNPTFKSARVVYNYLTDGELDMGIRRRVRAGMRWLHVLEDATEEELEKYKLENQSTLDDPFAAVSDFFSSKKGMIQAVQGDAQLHQIADIEHHQELLAAAAEPPLTLIGFGGNLNRDLLKEKLESYRESTDSLTLWGIKRLVVPLVEREWLLHGILPELVDYQIVSGYQKPLTPQDLFEVGRAINSLAATGLFPDSEILLKLFVRLVPAVGNEVIEAYRKAVKQGAAIIDRMSQEADIPLPDSGEESPVDESHFIRQPSQKLITALNGLGVNGHSSIINR